MQRVLSGLFITGLFNLYWSKVRYSGDRRVNVGLIRVNEKLNTSLLTTL